MENRQLPKQLCWAQSCTTKLLNFVAWMRVWHGPQSHRYDLERSTQLSTG